MPQKVLERMVTRGFFLGKFMPPHKGHLLVCDAARHHVDELTVLVCSHDQEPIDGNLRASWMRECLPQAVFNVLHMHRDIPQEPKEHPDFWRIWKDAIAEYHPEPIDWVFGSEEYVQQLAATLGARPFVVDMERRIFPVSGTDIRKSPHKNWDHIPHPVRGYFQKRVTLLGSESTGKSTLSNLLADHFGSKTIPEYGRDYDATFKRGADWNAEDFLQIANGQIALASSIAPIAGLIVIEDTDLLQTIVWAEALLGEAPQSLINRLEKHALADIYLLLSHEVPWVDDGTRYHSTTEERLWFQERLQHWLDQTNANWQEITATNWDARFQQALSAIKS